MECKCCCPVEGRDGPLSVEALSPLRVSAFKQSRGREDWRTLIGVLVGIIALCASGPLLAQGDSNYRLAPDDLLDFRVFQEPEMDAVIRVSGDGIAIFPLVGPVSIAGKTIGQATEMLRERYMAGYLVNPQITLTVREYARKVFTILGQVQQPGSFAIKGGGSISLLDAIGMAGGYTRIANPGKITVKRRVGGQETVIRVDARKMASGKGADSTFLVQPGDVITVGESIF
jgi:protein involved in polysaccharide export with SLBB domain